jgi:hypothetical protein
MQLHPLLGAAAHSQTLGSSSNRWRSRTSSLSHTLPASQQLLLLQSQVWYWQMAVQLKSLQTQKHRHLFCWHCRGLELQHCHQ